ncbi:hypothetical protein [Leptospira interrogans]|uniref:hypothetical protein n=1 Tax=Leptospira interrogans TaxID=173 RepID=UPI000A98C610
MNFQSINIRLNKRLTILLILICFSCKLQAQSNEAQTYYRNLTEASKTKRMFEFAREPTHYSFEKKSKNFRSYKN